MIHELDGDDARVLAGPQTRFETSSLKNITPTFLQIFHLYGEVTKKYEIIFVQFSNPFRFIFRTR
jgi:hypothetical protein